MSALAPIPTSTSVLESTVIRAPLSHVWHHIKLQDFASFWSALSKSEWVKGASDDTDIVKWTFKDGTILEVKQEEHSVCICLRPGSSSGNTQRKTNAPRPSITTLLIALSRLSPTSLIPVR
jgi:hypothetical protein